MGRYNFATIFNNLARYPTMKILQLLTERFQQAMQQAGLPAELKPHVALSRNAGFGDFQANGAMAAAKQLGEKPRDIAVKIEQALQIEDLAEKVEIAGPGFINVYLKAEWLASQLAGYACGEVQPSNTCPATIVIDYSSPNLAKEMHVGHLRSTIIGDAVARILEYQGHKVIRQNHVGDWGTQFGMLIAELETSLKDGEVAELALQDLEAFYKQSKKHFDQDESFADTARDYVVKLQSGDAKINELWQLFRKVSLTHSEEIYRKLNVTLTEKDVRGESAYNDDLPILVEELKNNKLAKNDAGALVVMLNEMSNKDGDPLGVIIQKKDGGYLYATTDLAAIRYRKKTLNADRTIYFIDSRQSDHMQSVFLIARKANFVDEQTLLEHAKFGTMLGPDGKPIKTREGDSVKLASLLDDAIEKAREVVLSKLAEKGETIDEGELSSIAEKVGIAAVKYADLSKTRTNDYIFNLDEMVKFEGNTGPYLQYAFTRTQSVFRKAETSFEQLAGKIDIKRKEEKALALKLLQFDEVVEQAGRDAYPHLLCNYLYEIASLYSSFYENCPILKDVDEETKTSRLLLNGKTAAAIKSGLGLLGIEVMNKM